MAEDFIMSPKIDFAFKELMQDEKVRNGFLSAILNLNQEMIKETVILDASLRKRTEEEKLGILDVRILLKDNITDSGTEIDIEIQLSYFKEWRKRSLFYWSKMYSDSLKEGEDYDKLKKCISISILDFKLIKDEKEYFSCYQLMETTRHTIYTDLIKFYVIELPKLPLGLKLPMEVGETNDVYLWAKFIASERKEEMEMLANESIQISTAYDRLKVISNDEQKKREYEARQRAIRDTISLKKQYMEEGREEGREAGREAGRLEGQNRINSLYSVLKNEGKIDDILRCTEDNDYLNHLLREYNL